MEQPEYTALQVTVFIRTQPGQAGPIQEFLHSVPFEAGTQETLSQWLEDALRSAGLPFEEIIIDLNVPAAKAQSTQAKKASPLARLFGKG
jgi:hypothetical protein